MLHNHNRSSRVILNYNIHGMRITTIALIHLSLEIPFITPTSLSPTEWSILKPHSYSIKTTSTVCVTTALSKSWHQRNRLIDKFHMLRSDQNCSSPFSSHFPLFSTTIQMTQQPFVRQTIIENVKRITFDKLKLYITSRRA